MLVRSGASWDKTAEVVVIGYGGAGAVAAITAAENGADVLILEKQVQDNHHTNTGWSGSMFINPSDAQSGLDYVSALCRVIGGKGQSWTDRPVIRAWAEYAATGGRWIKDRGGDIFPNDAPGEHPQLPGGAHLPKYRFRGMGLGMMRFLDSQVKARKVSLLYGTRANHLLMSSRGRVVGVEAETQENGQTRKVRIRASKAVVLAPGGFEYDEEMKINYLRVYPAYFTGPTALTGDGVRMAQEIGAKLWHMNCVSARLVLKYPELRECFAVDYLGKAQMRKAPGKTEEDIPVLSGYIIVDRDGNRFTSENVKSHCVYYELPMFDTHRLIFPRVPSYFVFDRKRIENGPLPSVTSGAAGPVRIYRWSPDNSVELAKGWIKSGGSIRELARRIGVPADSLERTVRTFNKYCQKGDDPDFNRKTKELIPLENPPYFATELWPGGPNTQGGPERNSKGQILNIAGNPIPGLYGCGELGSIYGMLYPGGGGNITECVAFGRIVGENAAAEKAH
ncbi:MAG: FAD-binding protein [Chloroflexi bacterium]|nr:FAD-binding protein [Chloroflexota bacterium]